jgi:hypothetical protein
VNAMPQALQRIEIRRGWQGPDRTDVKAGKVKKVKKVRIGQGANNE